MSSSISLDFGSKYIKALVFKDDSNIPSYGFFVDNKYIDGTSITDGQGLTDLIKQVHNHGKFYCNDKITKTYVTFSCPKIFIMASKRHLSVYGTVKDKHLKFLKSIDTHNSCILHQWIDTFYLDKNINSNPKGMICNEIEYINKTICCYDNFLYNLSIAIKQANLDITNVSFGLYNVAKYFFDHSNYILVEIGYYSTRIISNLDDGKFFVIENGTYNLIKKISILENIDLDLAADKINLSFRVSEKKTLDLCKLFYCDLFKNILNKIGDTQGVPIHIYGGACEYLDNYLSITFNLEFKKLNVPIAFYATMEQSSFLNCFCAKTSTVIQNKNPVEKFLKFISAFE